MNSILRPFPFSVKESYYIILPDFEFSYGQLAFYLFSAVIAKLIYSAVYNYYISPLKAIPGPRLNAITKLPIRLRRPEGRVFDWFYSLHRQYGPVVRVSPRMVLFADKDAVRQILVSDDLPKSEEVVRIRVDASFQTLFSADDKTFHKTRKRLLSPAFSVKYTSSLEPFMHSCVQTLVGIIHNTVMNNSSEKPTTVNLYQYVQAAAFDIIGETAFGESFKLLENGKHPLPIKVFEELRKRVLRATFPFLKPFLQQDPYTEEFVTKIIRERHAQNANGVRRHDILQILIDAKDEETGKGLTEFEIYDQVMEFLIAGGDTTAFTINMALVLLLQNPQALRSLVAELDKTFSDVRDRDQSKPFVPDHDSLKHLKYLNAVIKETLRRFPTALAGVLRQTKTDTIIGGYFIPKDTLVTASFYQVQNSKELWGPDAEEWIPERWLDADRIPRNCLYGFGGGSRICIGRHFAWAEMRIMLASLVMNFDLTVIPGQNLELVHFITPSLKTKRFEVEEPDVKDKYYSKVNEDKRVLIEMARISTGKIKTTLRRIQYVEKTNTSLLNSSSMGTASRATTTSSKSTWKPNPFTPATPTSATSSDHNKSLPRRQLKRISTSFQGNFTPFHKSKPINPSTIPPIWPFGQRPFRLQNGVMGVAVSYGLYRNPDVQVAFGTFLLFMGVAISITVSKKYLSVLVLLSQLARAGAIVH
ncbi:11680_t:CDS:2 [Paraglomus brasilianum]|uniref:11680_t:CDS:1 n=1 Tax=Paraglomus brasilianum TaxID=144538 RepID=A0A9N8W3X7_9GLOM|nr:11680_t:CDS:2 [Paraglomus brasilianum]